MNRETQTMFNSRLPMRVVGFWLVLLVLTMVFSRKLAELMTLAIHSDLESHIVLIPFISGYLFFRRRKEDTAVFRRALLPAAIILVTASGLLGLQVWITCVAGETGEWGSLFLPVVSFVVFVIGLYVLFFGVESFRRSVFPLLFLLVMVPMPEFVAHGIRIILQQWSADAAHAMFFLTGTPVFRDGMVFNLPGLTVEVAEECSGIHSSLVLFITSMVAGHLFLRKTWSKVLLVAAVFPLGILRNGFRVVVISLLTIHVDPEIIHSPLHHKGGPIFFALSLVVFLGLLWFLRWREDRCGRREQPVA
jgi:exosortase C (VPDSG-CTERM-specific)